MPDIESECVCIIHPDLCKFTTLTDGDTLIIAGMELDAGQAATIAWLINQSSDLRLEIKVKE